MKHTGRLRQAYSTKTLRSVAVFLYYMINRHVTMAEMSTKDGGCDHRMAFLYKSLPGSIQFVAASFTVYSYFTSDYPACNILSSKVCSKMANYERKYGYSLQTMHGIWDACRSITHIANEINVIVSSYYDFILDYWEVYVPCYEFQGLATIE